MIAIRERWLSGRKRPPRKRLFRLFRNRGFESPSLHQLMEKMCMGLDISLGNGKTYEKTLITTTAHYHEYLAQRDGI